MRNPILRATAMAVAALLCYVAIGTTVTALMGDGYRLSSHVARTVSTTLLVVPLVLVVFRYIDDQPISALGLGPSRQAGRAFLAGAVSWFAPFVVALILFQWTGWASIELTAPVMEVVAFIPLLVLLVFLYEALPEELVFREYIYQNLTARMTVIWVITIQAVLFGLFGAALWIILSGGISPAHALMFLVVGAVLGVVRMVTGSVWGPIGLHVAFQTAAQLLLNEQRGHFVLDNPDLFQLFVIGIIPFSLVLTLLYWFYPKAD